MEDMAVVFFYVEKCFGEKKGINGEKDGKRGRRRNARWWKGAGRRNKKESTEKSVPLRSIVWKYSMELKRFVLHSGRIPPESRYVYYAMDKQAEKILGRGREPIGMEWILFLLAYYDVEFDGFVLIQDRETEAEELIRYFAPKVAYLGVVADFFFDWDEVEESLSEEYGLVLDIERSIEDLHVKGERVLVIGAGEKLGQQVRELQDKRAQGKRMQDEKMAGANGGGFLELTWIDTAGRCEHPEMRKNDVANITYINMECFLRDTLLDTAHKIKYNNTR